MATVVVASALMLFVGVTLRTELHDADGYSLRLYGFPLPWRWPSLATSITDCIDPVALSLDFALALALVALMTWPVRAPLDALLARSRWLVALAVVCGVLALAPLLLTSLFSVVCLDGVGDGWTVTRRDVVWGGDAWRP